MSDNGFELSRRKILAGLGTVGVASAGAGMGTTAFLNDTESFNNNSLTAGELDLRIDWQQTYRNGVAGTPGIEYVNAHPDEDDPTTDADEGSDGIQSIWTNQYDSLDNEGLVEYTDDSKNLQSYINCETLDNHTADDFGGQDHLIELNDLKPGDSGEITFSFHLCDNPGCVWLQGGNLVEGENNQTEPEGIVDDTTGDGELLENLRVRAWYDIDCDNVYEDGESLIFGVGTLDEFFNNELGGNGFRLSPVPYGVDGVLPGGGSSNTTSSSNFSCVKLGKLEFEGDDQDQVVLDDGDSNDEYVTPDDEDEAGVVNNDDGDDDDDDVIDRQYRLSDGNESAVIDITGFERKDDGEVIGFYWEVDSASSDDLGICQVDVKGGGGPDATNSYVFEPLCIRDVQQSGGALYAPTVTNPSGSRQTAVSNAVFYYCKSEDTTTEIPCFPGQQTFCIGFEWFLPKSVGNEIQSDSVAFDLGFYTEQARHNDNPGQTI